MPEPERFRGDCMKHATMAIGTMKRLPYVKVLLKPRAPETSCRGTALSGTIALSGLAFEGQALPF